MNPIELPEYWIPTDLRDVLDRKLDVYSSFTRARAFTQVLEILKNVDYIDISENHYLLLLKLALYLEEYKCVKDTVMNALPERKVERFKDKKVTQLRCSKLFRFGLGDTIEDKLFIKPDDFVHLIRGNDHNNPYILRVTDVTPTHIIMANDHNAKFQKIYRTKTKFKILFPFNNYQLRRAHFALWLMHERNSLTYLFPSKSKPFVKDDTKVDYHGLKIINPATESNPEQKQAVLNMVNKSSFPIPYILYGPPGTGKTTTLVEAICQLHSHFPESNTLLCAPSDSAADKIMKMLLKFISPANIYRVYSHYKDGIDKEIEECVNFKEYEATCPTYEDVISKRVIVTSLRDCARILLITGMKASHFSHIIIDDAGCATEPDVLVPVSLVSEGGELQSQIVLAGDPTQLGPSVKSKIAKTILGRSILERLMSYDIYQKDSSNKYNPKYITKLLHHYRCHPDIIHVSNKLFYENELIPKRERIANEKFPVIFYGVEGPEEKESSTNSIYNMAELDVVVDYVEDLLNNRTHMRNVTRDDIGIITPFVFHSKRIQRGLKSKQLKNIKVGTVELFRADERKIMIVTTARSKTFVENGSEHIGILSSAEYFNVAMTRAKDWLYIVGNPNVLQVDDKWRYLIKYCIDNKSYDGIDFSLDGRSLGRSIDGKDASKTALVLKSSSLFDLYVLKLFTIDEFNPAISPQDVIADPALNLRYNNLVSPVGYWETHSSDVGDNFVSENPCDRVQSKRQDVFKNIDYFDVNEFIYMGASKNSYLIQKTTIENAFKNIDSYDLNEVADSSVIKNSLDESNNLLKGNGSQNVSDSELTKLEDSSKFEKPFDEQDLQFETDDSKNITHPYHTKNENSSSSKTSHNDEQKNISEDDILNNVSPLDHKKLGDPSDFIKSLDKDEELLTEIDLKNVRDHVEKERNNQLEVNALNNVIQFDHTTLEDSSDFKQPFDKHEDPPNETNDSEHLQSHSGNIEIEIPSASKISHDEQKDFILNNVSQPDDAKSEDLTDFKNLNKQEDLLLETTDSRSVSDHIEFENLSISKTSYDKEEDLPKVNILNNVIQCDDTKSEDSSDFKQPFDEEKDLPIEIYNSKNISQTDHTEFENVSASKASHGENEDLLEVNIFNNVSKPDYMSFGDASELEKFFDKQEELLLKTNNCQNLNQIEFGDAYTSENCNNDEKSLINSKISPKNIEHSDYFEFADMKLMEISIDNQNDLIDLNSIIKNDDLFNLIKLEDISENFNSVSSGCDISNSDYVDLL